ncbi:Lar family restriction alleviation protein [Brucella rhizosphaerae]|uniref:Lar family restriction alleviation protein n=1 Tax=Brucella rhizosphaerae TaxID=571254 RepID=UPI00137806F8|nr:Lar family restriction alleviation protein [Brucella rhizosphaerae]
MANELKPCPFCGNEPSLNHMGSGCFTVSCSNGHHINTEASKDKAIKAWNTRPAATDTGLVTVEYQVRSKLNGHWVKDNFLSQQLSPDTERRELVTRAQADELLAAKDATLQNAIDCVKVLTDEKNKLEADNAELTARVEAQAEHIATLDSNLEAMERRAKEGETQLAAARKDAATWEANFKELNAKYAARAALEAKP